MNFFILALLSLSIFILYVVFPAFCFYIHPVLSLITHGVSGGKIYFFLVFSFISFVILGLFKFRIKPDEGDKKYIWFKRFFIFFVFFGMASSIGSFLYYIYKYDLAIVTYHYHFKEVYNSVNFLPHIHTSKLYLFIIGKALGIEHLMKGMDNGMVFKDSIPLIFPYITLISIIVATFSGLFLIKEIVYKWDDQYQTGLSIISVISFSAIVKTISDGGPFSYDFLLGISVFYIITASKSPEEVVVFLKKSWRVLFWVFFLVLTLMCLIDPSFAILFYTLKNCFTVFMVYLAIYFFTVKNTMKKSLQVFTIICLILFFSYTFYMRYNIYIKPFEDYLEKDTQINYFYYKDRPLPVYLKKGTLLFDSDFLTIYALKTEKKTKTLEIYRMLGENPFRNRHVAIITKKNRQAYGFIGEILFIDFKNKKTSIKVPKIFYLKLTKKDSSLEKMNAEITFDSAYFPALSHVEQVRITQLDENHKFLMYYFLNRFFYHHGVNEYILTPVAFYRFN